MKGLYIGRTRYPEAKERHGGLNKWITVHACRMRPKVCLEAVRSGSLWKCKSGATEEAPPV